MIVTARTLSGKGSDYGGQALDGSVADVVQAIEAGGGSGVGWRCDVGDPASRKALADEVLARFGGIDILVNNATTAAGPGTYDVLIEDQYDRVFEVNVRGPLDLVQRFAPGMAERGKGWILNLTSKAAEHPPGPPYSALFTDGGMILYGAAKAALNRLTTGLAAGPPRVSRSTRWRRSQLCGHRARRHPALRNIARCRCGWKNRPRGWPRLRWRSAPATRPH